MAFDKSAVEPEAEYDQFMQAHTHETKMDNKCAGKTKKVREQATLGILENNA